MRETLPKLRRDRGLSFMFGVGLLIASHPTGAAEPSAPRVGHPTLLSPHSDPIAVHGQTVFVANTPSDTLDVIDASTNRVVRRIPTGIDPVSVAVRPDGKEVWVSNHISDSVSVIDNVAQSPTYLSVVATIQDIDLQGKTTRFDEPVGIAFANNSKAYVALSSSNRIAVVEVDSRRVVKHLKIPAQEPRALAVRNGKLYVIPFESNNQTQLSGGKKEDIDGDLVTFEAKKLAAAFDSAGFTVDVVKNPKVPDRDLFIFDTKTDELATVVESLGTLLFGLAVDEEGNVFIAHTDARNNVNGRAGTQKHSLKELENRPYLNRVTKVPAEGRPKFFHLNPLPPEQPSRKKTVATPFSIKVGGDGRTVFLTGAGSDHLVSLDAQTGETLVRLKLGAVPRGIALMPNRDAQAQTAWVLNAVANTVSKVDVSEPTALQLQKTIQLADPTPPEYKAGRIAFNTARASSNGTYSCASCHADGHTDQLLWVLDTPHLVGADQIEPRLSQTLRGLRGTAPYHWDGVPGDPYGGPNASTREQLPPNSDINKPESAVRHLIDGGMASTMLEHGSEIENDEAKKGYLGKAERDAMATFLLNLSHMPARARAYTDQLSEAALTGFERFHVTGARDLKNLNTNVCGSCHTMPYLATDQDSMNVPSFRGALDRFITQAQGRNSVIDLGGVKEVAERGFPEEEVWKRMLNMGEHGRLWPVIDMFKEASMGFSGTFGRQATLSGRTARHPATLDLIRALEKSAGEKNIVLQVDGRFHKDGHDRDVRLHFADGSYLASDAADSWNRDQLVEHASRGEFTGTFTGRHGPDITSPPPAIWTAGVLHKQRGVQLFPRINERKKSMVISARHLRKGATLLVDGRNVSGTIKNAGKELVEIHMAELLPKGMRMLQVRNPDSYLSNEFIFFVETRKEAVARYKNEPAYLLTSILNSALINDHPEEAHILIEAGADLNMPHLETHFEKERPPLIIAAHYGRAEMVEELLNRGADPNIRTKNGDTALHRAAHLGRLEICQMLLNAGADPHVRDKHGKRPIDLIHHFTRQGNFEKHHAPWNVNLTLDHDRYLREISQVKALLETAAAKDRPNVIILLADDLGSQDIGCYGGPVKTPALDELAAKGVRFTDFHAGAAICSPSRATLITGRQHLRTGIYGVLQDHMHNMHLLEREVTIPELLQRAGYGTAHFGKWHIGMTSGQRKKPSPTEHGFDYWFGVSNGAHPSHKDPVNFIRNGKRVGPLKGYSCQLIVDDAIRWLDQKEHPDQPFFLNLWFNEPHHRIAAPAEIVSLYGELKDEAAIYSATVDNTDRAIGRLVAKLKAMGKLDNTLIIYSSDHGSYRTDRNGGLKGNKGSNFQGGLRSPGIFYWPNGIRGGRTEGTPSGSVDLLPTICGIIGMDKPAGVHLDGADLSPLLIEKGTFQRSQPLLWLAPSSGHLATLREGSYTLMGYRGYQLPFDHTRYNEVLQKLAKLAGVDPSPPNLVTRVSNTTFSSPEFSRLKAERVRLQTFQESWIPAIKAGGFGRFALYDLSTDPLQKNDIAKQRPEVTERLKKKLLELYKDVMADAPVWRPLADAYAAQTAKPQDSPNAELLAKIDGNDLPKDYRGGKDHQGYVDRRMAKLSPKQKARVGQLFNEKRRINPNMPNVGASFVKILEYAAKEK